MSGYGSTGKPKKSTARSNYVLSGRPLYRVALQTRHFCLETRGLTGKERFNNETNWPRPRGSVSSSNLNDFCFHNWRTREIPLPKPTAFFFPPPVLHNSSWPCSLCTCKPLLFYQEGFKALHFL